MEDLKRAYELRIDEFSRGNSSTNQDTTNELTARIQELQNEVNCINDSWVFQGCRICTQRTIIPRSQSTSVISTLREPGRMPSRVKKLQPHKENAHGFSGHVFDGLHASASTPNAGMLNSWDSDVTKSPSVR